MHVRIAQRRDHQYLRRECFAISNWYVIKTWKDRLPKLVKAMVVLQASRDSNHGLGS